MIYDKWFTSSWNLLFGIDIFSVELKWIQLNCVEVELIPGLFAEKGQMKYFMPEFGSSNDSKYMI